MHVINEGADHDAEGGESRGGGEIADEQIIDAKFRHRGHALVSDGLGQSPIAGAPGSEAIAGRLGHDPGKWKPVF